MTISLYAINRREKFHRVAPGASENEMTISLSAINRREKFHRVAPEASANESPATIK